MGEFACHAAVRVVMGYYYYCSYGPYGGKHIKDPASFAGGNPPEPDPDPERDTSGAINIQSFLKYWRAEMEPFDHVDRCVAAPLGLLTAR